jgi:hypothetical protein
MKIAEQISRVNSVSLHVRRGDYVANLKVAAIHGLCSKEYYASAIKFISKKVERPHFFVFSDDINWVENNFKINYPCTYINQNFSNESYNDLRLMSLCQHNIIANSSFSWWGAWLNCNSEKIVIAPKKWFANSDKRCDDLIPEKWVRL